MEYIRRIVDDVIDKRTEAFNAVSITGPKGCGKTRTAKERCKTVIEFQDEDKREKNRWDAAGDGMDSAWPWPCDSVQRQRV